MKIRAGFHSTPVLSALVSLMLAFSPLAHSNPVTWTLEGVIFADGSNDTGSFTVDSVTGDLDNWDITINNGLFSGEVFTSSGAGTGTGAGPDVNPPPVPVS